MNKLIQHVNLRRYLPFYRVGTNNNHALAIYNKLGSRLILECNRSVGHFMRILQSVNQQNVEWDKINPDHNLVYIEGQGYVQWVALKIGTCDQSHWLLGIVQSQFSIRPEILDQYGRTLKHIGHCLEEDCLQTETMISMADELVIRHEELKRLCGIDDIDAYYKNRNEKEALAHLLVNCVNFLNLDQAMLYLPELEIVLYQTHSKQDKDIALLTKRVYQQLADEMLTHQETRVINQDGDGSVDNLEVTQKMLVSPVVMNNQQVLGILVLINDLKKPDFSSSDRKMGEILAAEAAKLIQARRDNITGKLNRRGLAEKINQILEADRSDSAPNCLFLINLDQFKVINDIAGQTGGDELLRQVNSLIMANLKKHDILGRLGADEFVVILKNCRLAEAEIIAERIRVVIKQFRYFYQDKLFDISASIGVVALNEEIRNFSGAIRAADLACKVAKEQGRNRIHRFEKDDENLLTHENQMQWVSRINIGIEENHFQLYRQKIQSLQGKESIPHYEILLRLKDKAGEILSPDHFIPAAERYNLMAKLDRWVILNTLEKLGQIKENQPQHFFSCSINLSGQSFCEEGFSCFIIEQIEKAGIPPRCLCFEITETAAVSNLTQAMEFIEKLKFIGCQFSLDDFGSGMSSFTYLKNLPVDYLKIDGYFVKTMLENEIDKAMVSSIHQIGSVMGLKTIAEFVENEQIEEALKIMGVDYGQGYGIGKPEPF